MGRHFFVHIKDRRFQVGKRKGYRGIVVIDHPVLGLPVLAHHIVVEMPDHPVYFRAHRRQPVAPGGNHPNFIRGLLPLVIAPAFLLFKPAFGLITSAAIVGVICIIVPLITLLFLEERFAKPLEWTEPY